jgi:hypothetical protein
MAELRYITHFDELTWIEGAMDLRYHECHITFDQRRDMLTWLHNNLNGQILIWPGLLQPPKHMSSGWGDFVAPDEVTCFLAFFDPMDDTRFTLEFVGRSVSIHRHTHKNANVAYHSRKGS